MSASGEKQAKRSHSARRLNLSAACLALSTGLALAPFAGFALANSLFVGVDVPALVVILLPAAAFVTMAYWRPNLFAPVLALSSAASLWIWGAALFEGAEQGDSTALIIVGLAIILSCVAWFVKELLEAHKAFARNSSGAIDGRRNPA